MAFLQADGRRPYLPPVPLDCKGSVFVGLLAGVWVARGVELTDTELGFELGPLAQ